MSLQYIDILGERIYWTERPKQKVGTSYSEFTVQREWCFRGSLNSNKIQIAVATAIPAFDIRGGITRFYDRHDINEEGGGVWTVPVSYRSKPAHWEMSVKTSGATAKMLQSYRTVRGYDCQGQLIGENPDDWRNGVIPDFKKAIGVHGDSVDGVDVPIPQFNFSIDFRIEMSGLRADYLMTLYDLTGRANSAMYELVWATLATGTQQVMRFAAGDLRFMGSHCKQTSKSEINITFEFMASKGLAGGTRTTAAFFRPDPEDGINPTANVVVDSVDLFSINNKIYIAAEVDGERQDAGLFVIDNINEGTKTLTVTALPTTSTAYPLIAANDPVPTGALVSADDDPDILVIGDSNPIKKKGWEYLWVRYEEVPDPVSNTTTRRPIAAYVEQVVRYGDFTRLGLGSNQ